MKEFPDSSALHAETVEEARKLIKRAEKCYTQTWINENVGVEVEVSKAALLRALSDMESKDSCGGILWDDGIFRLDANHG